MSNEQQREQLHKTIWSIADELRGAVGGWEFKAYVLGTLFYRFISENLTEYINNIQKEYGYEDFDYVREALKNGAFSYLVKPVDNEELVETVLNAGKKLSKNRNTQKYFERLSGELNAIKRQFLRELISGTIVNEKAISENLEFYKIELDMEDCISIYFKIDETGLTDSDNSPENLRHLENILSEIIINDAFQQIDKKAVFLNVGTNESGGTKEVQHAKNVSRLDYLCIIC